MKLAAIMRTDLIAIAEASPAYPCEGLVAIVEELKAIGPYWEASEDEIEKFDKVLDAAEAA